MGAGIGLRSHLAPRHAQRLSGDGGFQLQALRKRLNTVAAPKADRAHICSNYVQDMTSKTGGRAWNQLQRASSDYVCITCVYSSKLFGHNAPMQMEAEGVVVECAQKCLSTGSATDLQPGRPLICNSSAWLQARRWNTAVRVSVMIPVRRRERHIRKHANIPSTR